MQIVIMYLALSSGPKGGQGPNFHTQYVEAEGTDVGGRGQIYSVVGDKRSDIACTHLLLFRVTTLVIGLITIVVLLSTLFNREELKNPTHRKNFVHKTLSLRKKLVKITKNIARIAKLP